MMAPPKTFAAAAVRPSRRLRKIGCMFSVPSTEYVYRVADVAMTCREYSFERRSAKERLHPARSDWKLGPGTRFGILAITRYAECAARLHPGRRSPCLPGAACLWRGRWLRTRLREVDSSEWFQHG